MRLSILLAAPVVLASQPGVPQGSRPITNGGVPAVSPKGDVIAYISNRDGLVDLYVASTDGSRHVRITNDSVPETSLSWTSDGRLVYSTWSGTETSIYALSPQAPTPKVIGAIASRRPLVSPDGKQLLYAEGRFPEVSITVAAVDGSGARALTPKSLHIRPVFSPDQQKIAYGHAEANQPPSIWIMNADGTGPRQLTHFIMTDGVAEWPAWSPDGSKLALQVGKYDRQQPANSTAHIYVIDVATGESVKLNPHDTPYRDETPSWFPDGKRIAFQSDRSGRMEVWTMQADGTGAVQITR